ncbi:MAG: DUF4390 domain-containing protein [Fluviibacter sp.]
MISALRALPRWLMALVVSAVCCFQSVPAQAGAEVKQAMLTQADDGPLLTGYFALQLSPALTDAVNHGIPLVFQMQAEVRRPRWYWVDEAVFTANHDRRLTYNTLVRNYRVSEGAEGRNFQNLQDALNYVARPIAWTLPAGAVRVGETVDVAWRFRLDPAFLPKPFQVVSFGDRDWRLDSDWRNFRLTLPAMAGGR